MHRLMLFALGVLVQPAICTPTPAAELERQVVTSPGGYFPVLVAAERDELVAVLRGGAPHVGVGGRVDLVRSTDGGLTWSKPVTVADEAPDARNPALGAAPGGRLVLAYSVTGPYPDGRFDPHVSGHYSSWVRISDDGGRNFSEPRQLDTSPYPYSSPYGKIVSLSDGTLLLSLYTWYLPEAPGGKLPPEQQGDFACLLRSEDGGKTWLEIELIARGHNETALVVMEHDVVLAAMRDEQGGLSQSLSKDRGRTWSDPVPLLPPGQHPADGIRLASGRLLLAFGQRNAPLGVQAIWSDDNGTTWSLPRRVLLEAHAVSGDCGYPSSVQLADGTIVTMYYGVGHRKLTDLEEYALAVRYREDDLERLAVAEVGNQKQLFIDDRLVADAEDVTFRINPPHKTGEKLLTSQEPWEEFVTANYPMVLEDGGVFKLWYEAYQADYAGGDFGARLCYAESSDGAHWTRPDVGLVEFQGSKQNNIVYPNGPFKYHGGSVFIDPTAEPDQRYKLVSMGPGGINGATSPDGIHWTRLEEAILPGLESDTQNVCFWDAARRRYVLYCRLWDGGQPGQGLRAVGRSESSQFGAFPMATIVIGPKEPDPPHHDLYNNAAMKYPWAGDVYLAFISVFDQPNDTLEVQLATSRDGIRWDRHAEPPWIARGDKDAFDSMCVYQAPGCVRVEDKLYFYYSGYDVGHDQLRPATVQRAGTLSRAMLRLDGFRSAEAGEEGGTLTTVPLVFRGTRLQINAGGHVRVAILDELGQPIAGFTSDECEAFEGDHVSHTMSWKQGQDVSSLAGRPVQLKFELHGARLYAFQFTDE